MARVDVVVRYNVLQAGRLDSRWCYANLSLIYSLRQQYDPEVDSHSNRNEYKRYLLWGKGLKLLEASGNFEACTGIILHFS